MRPTKWSRRSFLRAAGVAGTVAGATRGLNLERVLAASQSVAGRSPEEVAKDEFYWREIQMDFELDRTIINLNNGFTCPTSRMALESEMRYLEMINLAPIFYQGPIADRIQTIRLRMAEEFGCEPEEMALTRGASESLQIVQNGLDMKPGDEVVTTEQDYPRMLTTWDQRMRRDGIKVHRLQFPVPTTADDLYHRFEQAITPQTKVFHFMPHHQPDGAIVSGRSGSPAWPARKGSSPSSTALTPWGNFPSSCGTSSAMPTASACTSGCWRRSEMAASTCARR